jgi:hypothetical protein
MYMHYLLKKLQTDANQTKYKKSEHDNKYIDYQ